MTCSGDHEKLIRSSVGVGFENGRIDGLRQGRSEARSTILGIVVDVFAEYEQADDEAAMDAVERVLNRIRKELPL